MTDTPMKWAVINGKRDWCSHNGSREDCLVCLQSKLSACRSQVARCKEAVNRALPFINRIAVTKEAKESAESSRSDLTALASPAPLAETRPTEYDRLKAQKDAIVDRERRTVQAQALREAADKVPDTAAPDDAEDIRRWLRNMADALEGTLSSPERPRDPAAAD